VNEWILYEVVERLKVNVVDVVDVVDNGCRGKWM